nr:MAG TPA: hypothetical protein [Caudoviricetes sp.]
MKATSTASISAIIIIFISSVPPTFNIDNTEDSFTFFVRKLLDFFNQFRPQFFDGRNFFTLIIAHIILNTNHFPPSFS